MLQIHEFCRSGDLDGIKSLIYNVDKAGDINIIDENVRMIMND